MNLLSEISRDSISSNHGDDSNRSSIATLSRSHHRNHNKKILIDLRTFNKLTNFLSTVIKELNLNLEDFKEITSLAEYAQTEEVNISLLDEDNKDKISIDYNNHVEELNKIIQIYRKELEDSEFKNNLLVLENRKLKEELDKNKDELKIILEETGKLKNQIDLHKEEIKTILLERNNFSKNTEEVSILNTKGLEIKENQKYYFSDEKLIKSIACYLNPKEYILFSHMDRNTKRNLLSNNSIIDLLKLSINSKNYQISNLLSFDWKKEYEISDIEIEKLIKEYIQINKIPGLDLKNLLTNSLNYIKNDIKKYLGIAIQPELAAAPKKSSSFLSSLNNVFGKIVNKKEEAKIKKIPGTFENISEYDNYLINDFSSNFLLNVKFDISSAEELKNLLVTFFTSVRNNPQSISNFIAKLINEYADFVFYAYRTLVEIKEIEIVKNAMHERFRKYYKICAELENELDDLKKFAKTNKEIKDILLRQKQEIEVKYTDCNTQITYLKDELNKTSNKLLTTTEKYNKIEQEYDSFKAKLVKEFKFLKSEYETAQSERNLLKEALFEFKKYFMRFHISDDGDINYVEPDKN